MVEGPGKRSKDCDYIADIVSNIPVDHGNSKAYTVSRLKRDRPDLFEKVVAGELSANKAAIEAGFRRKPERKVLYLKLRELRGVREKGGNGSNQHAGANTQNCTFATPTQAKYASEIGVSHRTVNDWESDAKILD